MLLEWLADRLAKERFDIGRDGDVYLTRWTLRGRRFGGENEGRVFLHCFRRSDRDVLHDHPWPFVSLILWGGYWEVMPRQGGGQKRRWYPPGSVLVRPAAWAHKVELPPGQTSWSVVWTGPKERRWGFHCPDGWRPWQDFIADADAGRDVCPGKAV